MPNICPNAECQLSRMKVQQHGRAKCMKCGAEMPDSAPLTLVTPQPTEPVKDAGDDDWIAAARWAAATLCAEKRGDLANLNRSGAETLVKAYWTIAEGGTPDGDDVRLLAKKARDNADALALVAGWADFVTGNLQRVGQSPALTGNSKTQWGTLSAAVRGRVQEIKSGNDIYTGLSTGGGGAMICIHYNLLEEVKSLKFSLAHETGHMTDIALRCGKEPNVELQKALRKKDSYTPKPTGDHEMEYFADAFATVLLLSSGMSKNEVAEAATELFSGSTVGSEHPSGPDRLENIAAVCTRHLGG